MATISETSRQDFECKEGELSFTCLQFGALQRIADACELMAADQQTKKDSEFYRDLCKRLENGITRLSRSNAALRGQITKLKRDGK